jgi:hypothetical protein
MRIRHGFIIIVACIAIQTRSHPCMGAQVLDQSYLPTTFDTLFNLGVAPYTAQTVTAGITGYLTEADLDIIREEEIQTQPWEVTVRTVDSQGAPTGTILATQILPRTAAPAPPDIPLTPQMVVQFSNPAFITAGEKFALVIDSIGFVYQSGGSFAGLGAASGGFPGDTLYPYGSAYTGDASGSFSKSNDSLIFATYVTVPEPSSFLAIAGLAWLGMRRGRRISAK